MSVMRSTTRPSVARVIGFGALAGVLAVTANLAIRGAALALLREPAVPFPLAVGADVVFHAGAVRAGRVAVSAGAPQGRPQS